MILSILGKFKPYSYVIIAFICVLALNRAYSFGQASIQSEWDKAKLEYLAELSQINEANQIKELEYRRELAAINFQLSEANTQYETAIANLTADYTNRLQQSEYRASVYQRQASSGADQCRGLADYTTELDRIVIEGRQLVTELRDTLRLREQQIDLLVQYLQTENSLVR